MIKPTGIRTSAISLLCLLCALCWANAESAPSVSAGVSPAAAAAAGAAPAAAAAPGKASASDPAKRRFQRPAPLKRLVYSAKQGFSIKMVSAQDVSAEIRNGAGRTLARNAYTLEAGDWTLRPRNLPPGLYTILLRTGPQLRSMRMKIEESERGKGSPEWVLERVTDSTRVAAPSEEVGAFADPARE